MSKLKRYSKSEVRDNPIIFGAFDTETKGLGGELLAITCSIMGTIYYYSGEFMLDEFIAKILDYPDPVVWYAHHAQYDWRYILPFLIDAGYQISLNMRTDDDIYQILIKHDKKKITMRDSIALFPTSLDKIASTFCPEIPKLKIDIENFEPTNPDHIEYAKRDSEILSTALPRIDTLLRKHFNVGVGHTTAGTAMAAWQHSLPNDTYYHSSKYNEQEEYIRSAYYGGLVFLTRTDRIKSRSKNEVIAETYDINSSYPSIMVDYGIPTGRVVETTNYLDGRMGIYHVKISTPENLIIPIIPCRNKKGGMQWRSGIFDTVVTSSELIFAANHGHKILEIYSGIAFEHREFPFNDFINNCKNIRREFKGQPQEALAKLMQNSLYGKFGSRRERLNIFHPETDEDLLGASPIDTCDYFWVRKEFDELMKCKPEWAVFITAHARLKILQAAYSVGIEHVIYGDTDSITILAGHAENIAIGDEYGQFKLEKQWTDFRAIAPKVYAGTLLDGTQIGAAKGLSKKALRENPHKWNELLVDGHTDANYLSLPSLRIALEKGVAPAKQLNRKSTNIKNSSNWYLLNDRIKPKIYG